MAPVDQSFHDMLLYEKWGLLSIESNTPYLLLLCQMLMLKVMWMTMEMTKILAMTRARMMTSTYDGDEGEESSKRMRICQR